MSVTSLFNNNEFLITNSVTVCIFLLRRKFEIYFEKLEMQLASVHCDTVVVQEKVRFSSRFTIWFDSNSFFILMKNDNVLRNLIQTQVSIQTCHVEKRIFQKCAMFTVLAQPFPKHISLCDGGADPELLLGGGANP